MKQYIKPFMQINDILVKEKISAAYSGEDAEGNLQSSSYIGPENSTW